VDVFAKRLILFPISDPAVMEALFPDRSDVAGFAGAEGEPASDELQSLFQGKERSQQYVEVVRHQNKFMEQVAVGSVEFKDFEEKKCILSVWKMLIF
jgi:hypothetical protein